MDLEGFLASAAYQQTIYPLLNQVIYEIPKIRKHKKVILRIQKKLIGFKEDDDHIMMLRCYAIL